MHAGRQAGNYVCIYACVCMCVHIHARRGAICMRACMHVPMYGYMDVGMSDCYVCMDMFDIDIYRTVLAILLKLVQQQQNNMP